MKKHGDGDDDGGGGYDDDDVMTGMVVMMAVFYINSSNPSLHRPGTHYLVVQSSVP